MRWRIAISAISALVGCRAEIPDATYVCATTAECPPGLTCDVRGLCVRDATCMPASCEELRAECGAVDDGCGAMLACGECTAPETCGGDGVSNVCGCEPRQCTGEECGVVDNGCGALMDCGGCDAPLTCGADHTCGCAPMPCGPGQCGMVEDGCGGLIACPDCPAGEFCGGGGFNLCGDTPCIPMSCADQGLDCGPATDGCGVPMPLPCGSCTPPETCGGGPAGMTRPGVCGCTPQTCGELDDVQCGGPMERCGTTLSCGSCSMYQRCDRTFRCVCEEDAYEPREVWDQAYEHGDLPDAGATIMGSLHSASDIDWHRWEVGGSGGSFANLTIRLDGLGANRAELHFLQMGCDDIGSDPSCAGTPISEADGAAVGCATGPGVSHAVTVESCHGRLYVGVVLAGGWGGYCGPYTLTVQ